MSVKTVLCLNRVLPWGVAAYSVALLLGACSGARHRKVTGPPPEYEHPDEPGALEPRDGGGHDAPSVGSVETRPPEFDAGFVLISPDGRR